MFNKSFVTNLLSFLLAVGAYLFIDIRSPWRDPVMHFGIFAFSGSITNWIAVHMLFEKVPGIYGSGIIPNRFESFKNGIRTMIMDNFFTEENFAKFAQEGAPSLQLDGVLAGLDFSPVFDGLKEVVGASKLGGMLSMFGGTEALEPLREPFSGELKSRLQGIVSSPEFNEALMSGSGPDNAKMREKVEALVDRRLEELTPQMVKDIIQRMIRRHLGWLVVWGGVFGGIIGLVSSMLKVV